MVALVDGSSVELESVTGIEVLEDLDAPWDWGDFFTGFGAGLGIVGLGVAGAGLVVT